MPSLTLLKKALQEGFEPMTPKLKQVFTYRLNHLPITLLTSCEYINIHIA